MVYFFFFLFGICLGSFLSCLVYRLNHNLGMSGRSVCDHCEKQISWYDNIPLVSYLMLGGKCRKCRSPIPARYFLTELGTGIITFIIFIFFITSGKTNFLEIIFSLTIAYFLVALFISDLNYQTIPDLIVFPAIAVALSYKATRLQSDNVTMDIISILTVTGLFFLLSRLKIRGQQAMGFGDVELVFLMGLFLSFPKILIALYLAFLTGALVGVILIILNKKKLQSAVPFGPFLIAGTFIAYFLGNLIWEKIMVLL